MRYFKKLIGDKCYLSPINIDDYEKYAEWLNDFNVVKYLSLAPELITLDKEKKIIERLADSDDKIFGIISIEDDKLIGNVGLHNINYINRRAMLGIFIGEIKKQNQGIGQDAIELILDFGFNLLNLNSIYLYCLDFNKKAKKCYINCGFREVGRYRESRIINGEKFDGVIMDILSSEFKGKYIKKAMEDSND